MLGKTKAIVLHAIKHGESGRIIKLYTDKYGLISILVKSTQSKRKGSTAALYQPLITLEMDLDVREDRGLQRVVSASLIHGNSPHLLDPVRSCVSLFLAELFYRTAQEGEVSVELFELLDYYVTALGERSSITTLPLEFILDLAVQYGIYPDIDSQGDILDLREGLFTNEPPTHREVLHGPVTKLLRSYRTLGHEGWEEQVNKIHRTELMEGMLLYFQIHIPHFRNVNSYAVIRDIFRT